MVKRSKKSKSKRVPLKKKYKIIRKVKEHQKKKAKEAKKLGINKKPKAEKDPGIPNDWPFKEQELKALEARRQRAIQEQEEKKAARKERAQKRKLGLLDDDELKDESSVGEGKISENSTVLAKKQDHSERAFYKELVKVIEASDVILEVLDARDPLGSRCIDMENMVMKAGPEKHLVLLLNKIDLVPREAAEKWLKYFREELPTVAFKCSTQEQKSNLGWKSGPKSRKTGKTGNASTILKTSDCLGAETLIKLLKNYSRSHEIKKSITVGVIGLPNVGKSSLINSLKRSHVANVGATPGLTRSMQEVQLDKHVKLLDCPGVVMLKSVENDASVALRNCKRIEKLDDPIVPVKEILKRCPERVLVTLYKVPSFDSVDDFLQKVATIRGRLKKGGVVDIDAAARIVLHDWNTGKIPYYTLPPIRNEGEPSDEKIVAVLGKEFNIDEVYGGESSFIGSLKSVNDFNPVEVPSNGPLNFDEKMLEDDVSLPDLNQSKDSGDQVGNGEDHSMESGDEEGGKEKTESTNSRQNKKLYTEEGMLNTKLRKAEKKRRKKENKSSAMEHDMDNDYDFKVDYARKESAMDVGDEEFCVCLIEKEMAENKLYDAAVKGDVKSLLDLLKEDPLILARVSFTCSDKTPLHIATIFQHTAFVQEILRRNPLLAAELDSHQSSSLHIASAKGYAEIVKAIVSATPDMCLARDCHGRNPLHLAAINGQVRVFNELIKNSSLAVREKTDRGQTLLHLCVKHQQLQVMGIILCVINDYEFVNAKNDDGDTILHLAVRTKHFETVQYLMGTTGIDVNAKNANGYTALDILELTPTELRDTDNYLSIENCLQPKAFDSINPRIQPIKWLTKKRDAVMVVAILIATMAFQAGVTPPGGVWQDDATDNSHKAGESVMAYLHPKAYERFIRANTIAFISSLSTILLLISGLPFRRRLFMWSLMVIMWLTVTSIAVTYAVSIDVFTPKKDKKSLGHVIQIGLIVWCSVMGILLVGNTVRLLDWWLQKRGITVWRPRRFRHLDKVNNRNVNQEGA